MERVSGAGSAFARRGDVSSSVRTSPGYSRTTQATRSATRCPGGCGLAHSSRLQTAFVMPHAVAMMHRLEGPKPAPEVALHHELVHAADGAIDLDAPVPLRVEPRPARQRRVMRCPLALGRSDLPAAPQALVVQRAVAASPVGPGRLGAPVDCAVARIDLLAVMAEAQASRVEAASAYRRWRIVGWLGGFAGRCRRQRPLQKAVRSQSTITQRRC